jgi:membrane-associated protein
MTDWLLGLVPQYGAWLLAVCTFCSCLALPIPASVLMLTAGGFASAGDLSLTSAAGAALAGAVGGDQTGYFGGRWGGAKLIERLGPRAAPIDKAREMLARRGGLAIFFTRWLLSALGPYVNLAAGAARQPWAAFTAWGVAGELVWVSLYTGLGYYFTGNLEAASAMAVDILGMLAAGAVALGLGWWLVTLIRAEGAKAAAE